MCHVGYRLCTQHIWHLVGDALDKCVFVSHQFQHSNMLEGILGGGGRHVGIGNRFPNIEINTIGLNSAKMYIVLLYILPCMLVEFIHFVSLCICTCMCAVTKAAVNMRLLVDNHQ